MKLLENVLKKSATSIKKPVCKVCFKDINYDTMTSFINEDNCLCHKCFKSLNYDFQKIKVGEVEILSLAKYQDPLANLLINYKENKDVELAHIFLNYFIPILKFKYHGYKIICVPSSKEKEKERGFSHLKLIFDSLNLQFFSCLEKTDNFEQKKMTAEARKNNSSKFKVINGDVINGKKILLVDDVMTTGSSIKACLHLISSYKPKKLNVLVLMIAGEMKDYEIFLKQK